MRPETLTCRVGAGLSRAVTAAGAAREAASEARAELAGAEVDLAFLFLTADPLDGAEEALAAAEEELEPDFFPPRLEAPGEFAMRAARSFDIPFSLSFSYCFSFFTLARLPGIFSTSLRSFVDSHGRTRQTEGLRPGGSDPSKE